MKSTWFPPAALSLSLLLSFGVHAGDMNSANVVDVVAKNMHYQMPDSIPAGPTIFHFTNEDNTLHHMTLVKLANKKTVKDFATLPPGPLPKWVTFYGGPNAPHPHGGTDEVEVNMTPGHYGVVCLIPGPDGVPHMVHGMYKAFTVTASTKHAHLPKADDKLTLVSYNFKFSKPLTPGKHVIEVVNTANEPHEALMVQMSPGKTGADMAHWVEKGMKGPPPGTPIGGISPITPGEKNYLMIDLKKGNYALLCFMPAKDGKLHVAHGMIYDFKV